MDRLAVILIVGGMAAWSGVLIWIIMWAELSRKKTLPTGSFPVVGGDERKKGATC